MNSKHYLAFGVGVVVGWLVLPMVLGMFAKKSA